MASCPGNTQTHMQLRKKTHRKSGGESGTLQLAAGSWQQTLPQRRPASLALVIDHINDEDTFFIWPTAFFFFMARSGIIITAELPQRRPLRINLNNLPLTSSPTPRQSGRAEMSLLHSTSNGCLGCQSCCLIVIGVTE